MQGVTESMAGRAAILTLLPMSNLEHAKVGMLHGGYPEVLARPKAATLWFDSYLQTYLERDVRAVLAIKDLATFRRFLALVASRHGQILNRTDLAAPLGISVPTVQSWLNVLEATAQIFLVPPSQLPTTFWSFTSSLATMSSCAPLTPLASILAAISVLSSSQDFLAQAGTTSANKTNASIKFFMVIP